MLSLKKAGQSLWQVRKNIEELGGERDFFHPISLDGIPEGKYSIEVSLLDEPGRILLFESTDLSITAKAQPGDWVITQSNPPAGDAYYSYVRGVQYLNKGENIKALPELAEACRKQPDSLNFALSYARALFLKKDFAAVKDLLTPFAEARADHFGLFFSLGQASEGTEAFRDAIVFYQKALDIQGGIADVLNRIGECWLRLGDKEAAIRAWQKSLEINPDQDALRTRIKTIREKLRP